MADFPVVKTVAVPDVTPIMSKHINNLENKVGITGSADTASLDYQVTDIRAKFNVDHDLTGAIHHRPGVWQIGTTPVTSDASELNKLDGAGANVTFTNLNSLVDGADIGVTLHRHNLYLGPINSSLMNSGGPYPNLNDSSKLHGFLCFWINSSATPVVLAPILPAGPKLHILPVGRDTVTGFTNLRIRYTLVGATLVDVSNRIWDLNNSNIGGFDWSASYANTYTYPTNPPNSGADKLYWGGTAASVECVYNNTGDGDALHFTVAGISSATQITEVVSNGGNQGFDHAMLGSMWVAGGFGNVGQKIVFTLDGNLVQLV